MARQCRLSVLNQKGGVGKSTTVANLGVALASRGHRVLIVDFDAQANATQFLGVAPRSPGWGSAEFVLDEASGFHPVVDQLVHGLDVVPATEGLALVERRLLSDLIAGPRRFRKALDRAAGRYDYVLTDCGPTLGMMALNAIVACPGVLAPIELAPAAVVGALTLRRFIDEVRADLEPRARIFGALGTFMDDREVTPRHLLPQLAEIFGPALFSTVIHTSAAIRDASALGRPVVLAAPESRGAAEYQALSLEVTHRGTEDDAQ
jgi:chromosome partitioning protein